MYRFSIIIKIQNKIKKKNIYTYIAFALFFSVLPYSLHRSTFPYILNEGGKRARHKSIKRVGATIHRPV